MRMEGHRDDEKSDLLDAGDAEMVHHSLRLAWLAATVYQSKYFV